MMKNTIYFDMDGTIANLYGVENWLNDLINSDVRPYREAKPLLNFSQFAKLLHKLQDNGYKIGIISWLSKNGTASYNTQVTATKLAWLEKHLPSVQWDEIHIVNYGTPKSTCSTFENAILFDDEERNRNEWNGIAYDVNEIINTLKSLL